MSPIKVPAVPEDTLKFVDLLIQELNISPWITKSKKLLNITGSKPVYPHPHKSQAISSALTCLLGLVGTRILELRGSEDVADAGYKVSINTDQVSIFNTAFILGEVNGHSILSPEGMKIIPNVNEEPRTAMTARSMEIYETKDKKFFMLHASVKPSACLRVIGLTPAGDMTEEEARKKIADRVKLYDAEELRKAYAQAGLVGDIVLKPDEFDATEHGRILSKLPLASLNPMPMPSNAQPPASRFPPLSSAKGCRPLEGIRVLELTRMIAGPVAGRLLAELGAEVTRVIEPSLPDASIFGPEYNVNKRSIFINLKTPEGQKQMSHLLETADIFLQGYRPGVMGRLGLSHERLSEIASKRGKPIVVIDESCYGGGAEGSPWAERPGYQQIADTLTGIAWENGLSVGHSSPMIPCFAISDHCGGQLCALMALLGLLQRTKEAGSIYSSVALCSIDLWIRNQEKYPVEWVRETYGAGPQLNFDWGFVPLAIGVIDQVKKTAPGHFKPEFFETIETDRWGEPTSFHHMGPLIKFGEIKTRFSWTGPYGYDRVGWDDQDADVLAQILRAG